MGYTDYKPDRIHCVVGTTEVFIKNFFATNPLSRLCILVMSNSKTRVLSSLASSPDEHIEKLQECKAIPCAGSVSLQNTFERGRQLLDNVPTYGTREIIVIFGSMKTFDSSSIDATVEDLKRSAVRIYVVSLTPELYVLKHISVLTGGSFRVVLDKQDFRNQLLSKTSPPTWNDKMETKLVRMGFPPLVKQNTISLCMCHNRASTRGYICTSCRAKCCEIPSSCRCCGLDLVSSTDMFKTHRHLFPPALFKDNHQEVTASSRCAGCDCILAQQKRACPDCSQTFCLTCDAFVHNILHQCITCFAHIKAH